MHAQAEPYRSQDTDCQPAVTTRATLCDAHPSTCAHGLCAQRAAVSEASVVQYSGTTAVCLCLAHMSTDMTCCLPLPTRILLPGCLAVSNACPACLTAVPTPAPTSSPSSALTVAVQAVLQPPTMVGSQLQYSVALIGHGTSQCSAIHVSVGHIGRASASWNG